MNKTSKKLEFTGENFPIYKIRLQNYMEEKELWGVLSGTDTLATQNGANAIAAWNKKDRRAKRKLGETLDDTNLLYITNEATSADAWNKLKSIYEPTTVANKQLLRQDFQNVKMDESGTLTAHLEHILSIANQLGALGARPADDDIVSTCLLSLPEVYSPLVTSLESGNNLPSFVDLHVHLMHEDLKHNCRQAVEGYSTQTKFAKQANSRKSSPKIKITPATHPELYTIGATCSHCGKPNHTAAQCQKKQGGKSKTTHHKQGKDKTARKASTAPAQLFVSCFATSTNPAAWYLDSGASQHMANDQVHMYNVQHFQTPVAVYLGDDKTVYGDASGCVDLELILLDSSITNATLTNVLHVPALTKNLFSISKGTAYGCTFTFKDDDCFITNSSNQTISYATVKRGLYKLHCRHTSAEALLTPSQPVPPAARSLGDSLHRTRAKGETSSPGGLNPP